MGYLRLCVSMRVFTLYLLICQISAFVFTTKSTSSDMISNLLIPTTDKARNINANMGMARSKSLLFSTPPKRVARRDLKKVSRHPGIARIPMWLDTKSQNSCECQVPVNNPLFPIQQIFTLFPRPLQRTGRKRDGLSKTLKSEAAAEVDDINIETRSLVRSKSIEAGEDYWIDEVELEQFSQREQAVKNRIAMEGEIPKEKLQQEVVAPYKQNWIGLLSVAVVVLAAIIKEFPDLLNSPMIPIPDL